MSNRRSVKGDGKMQIVFLTNFLTPHQIDLYRSFISNKSIEFYFIECVETDKTALPIGWRSETDMLDNLVTYGQLHKDFKHYRDLIDSSDAVIIGSAPDSLIENRLKLNKLTFKYAERFYKTGFKASGYLRNMLAAWLHHGRFQKYPLYMLCASAYTAADCAKFGNYKNRCYKWGYFPELKKYDGIKALIENKAENSLLWAGRLIDFKHPELALRVAKRLMKDGYSFKLNIIGTGELEEKLRTQIKQEDLEDCVCLLGQMRPEKVREYMEQSEIFLFTSDRNEGWGAVLNEAMNSACAVVAGSAIGSVPFLIKDGENGFIYEDGNTDGLYERVKYLLDNDTVRENVSVNAYNTIINEWNAENAARKFVGLAQSLLDTPENPCIYENGVCSKAEYLKDNWYSVKEVL